MEQGQKRQVEERARELVERILVNEGFELVDVEYAREREGWVLRLFIDKPGGVGLDDCTKASRAVDTALEVEDLIPHEYCLEVSSPGLNRPLKRPAHFQSALGKRVKVKTYGPVEGTAPPRKSFTGVLAEVDETSVVVEVEGAGAFRIQFRDIAKANLEYQF